MKKHYTEDQIIAAIKKNKSGIEVDDICRSMGISIGTFYYWRSKYARLTFNESKRVRELENENDRLRRVLSEKLLENALLKDILQKNIEKLVED